MRALNTSAAGMSGASARTEPVIPLIRIGSTYFEITVHFSETSKETFEDKILRLILSETEVSKIA